MNEVIKSLMERKSMRVYLDKEISAEDKKAILIAAMAAPTAGNQQLYTILDITDQSLKETLAKTCDNQPFIAKAKMVLIFCADAKKWQDVFLEAGCNPREPGVGDLMLAVEDAVIAAQNAVTAAESLGIGSCYIGDIMEQCETHRELLHLPKYVFPAAMVVLAIRTSSRRRERSRSGAAWRMWSTRIITGRWTGRSCGKCLAKSIRTEPLRSGRMRFAGASTTAISRGR